MDNKQENDQIPTKSRSRSTKRRKTSQKQSKKSTSATPTQNLKETKSGSEAIKNKYYYTKRHKLSRKGSKAMLRSSKTPPFTPINRSPNRSKIAENSTRMQRIDLNQPNRMLNASLNPYMKEIVAEKSQKTQKLKKSKKALEASQALERDREENRKLFVDLKLKIKKKKIDRPAQKALRSKVFNEPIKVSSKHKIEARLGYSVTPRVPNPSKRMKQLKDKFKPGGVLSSPKGYIEGNLGSLATGVTGIGGRRMINSTKNPKNSKKNLDENSKFFRHKKRQEKPLNTSLNGKAKDSTRNGRANSKSNPRRKRGVSKKRARTIDKKFESVMKDVFSNKAKLDALSKRLSSNFLDGVLSKNKFIRIDKFMDFTSSRTNLNQYKGRPSDLEYSIEIIDQQKKAKKAENKFIKFESEEVKKGARGVDNYLHVAQINLPFIKKSHRKGRKSPGSEKSRNSGFKQNRSSREPSSSRLEFGARSGSKKRRRPKKPRNIANDFTTFRKVPKNPKKFIYQKKYKTVDNSLNNSLTGHQKAVKGTIYTPNRSLSRKQKSIKMKRWFNKFDYYVLDLKKCMYGQEDDSLTESQIKFREHFCEVFDQILNRGKFRPKSSVELEKKVLGRVMSVRVEKLCKASGFRILLLDLDETLIHARYVFEDDDWTFQLDNERGGKLSVRFMCL